MGDVEEEIDEIEDEYEDDFDVDDEDGAATAHDAPQAPRETEPTAGSVSLANCTTGGFPGSDAQNTTAAAGVQGEDETLEERIKRKQEEAIAVRRKTNVEAGDAALDSAKTKLVEGDHAGARAELGNARKAFKTAGIEKPELAQLDLDIAAQEREAEVAAAKAREEQEALAAREAAAKAAAFKAGAEAAAKAAKEEADAKRAAEDAGRAQAKAAAAAKAREEEEARAATEAAAAEKQAEVERQTAAAAFAEKKRREKEAKETAAAAQCAPGGQPATTPRQADIDAGASQASAPAQTASSSWPLTGMEGRLGERDRQPITQRRTRPPSALQIPASPGPREATQDRKGSIRSVKVMAGSPQHQHGASANAAASPSAASLAALQAFELPEPQLWATLLGLLEDADVHSTGVVTEYTASRILKKLELPLSEDAWRHAMSLASVATSPSKSKGVSEACVLYKELVTELAHMHERAMKQRRIDAVLASVSVQGGNHLSEALRALPTELLQDAAALGAHVLRVLGEAPISLPEHLLETAVGLGKTAGGELSIEKLLNALAKSAVRDPFEHVRTKLLQKYGRLTTAFLAISRLLGASKAAKGGEVAISMDQLRTALSELGGLSTDMIEHVVLLADADGSNSIDYKEFITMFSKRITVVRRRTTVLVPDQQAASKSPHDRPGSISGQKSLSSQDLEAAEWSMLRQLTESSWSLGDAFRALDPDGQGSIPASQLRQRLSDLGTELSFNELQTIIAKVDTNNDGIISFAEFVSRYRLQPVVSSCEAKSDTVIAMSSKYKSPIQAYQVACGGHARLTRLRLKAFIRSLGLGLHDATIEEMCTEVNNVSTQSQREDLDESSSTSSATLSDELSFVDFLRLFRLDSACLSKTGMWTRAKTTFCAGGHTVLLLQLQEALRERMRASYGTLKTAFTVIDKDHKGVISRKELRDALTTPPLNLGLDAATINAIIEQADVDGNGKIDFSEFSQMFSYGEYQDELRKMRRLASSFKSTSIMRAPAAPLIPQALQRFWMMLQSNFNDITLAFQFINGISLRFSGDGSLVASAPAAAFSEKHTTKTQGLSEQDFELGIGRLELLHRLRQALSIAYAPTPRDACTLPSKRRASSSSASGRHVLHVRSSWPNARMARGVKVDTQVLDVLMGCPGSVTMQTRCKLLEVVCGYTHDQSLQLLQHADRVRKQKQGEGKCTAWPEFTHTIEDMNSISDGHCTPAQQMSLAGQQAISIFRALDVDASGELSEAALVRALSKWLAVKEKEQEHSWMPPDTAKQEDLLLCRSRALEQDARQGSLASQALPTVSEHVSSALHSAQGSSPAADAAAQKTSKSSSSCAGGLKNTMTSKASDWLAPAPAPAPSQAVVQSRAALGGVNDGKALTKQLKALRDEDVLVLQKRLQEIEYAHGEATSRILRAEQREAAVREHEAAVKVQQANADERERSLRMREHALSEHENRMALLNAEVAHKAHELEETARVLQQRKSAVEHREKLLQQQVAHVQKLQDMVNRTYEQHDTVARRYPHHNAENPPATGTKHEYSTGGTNQHRRALQSQQQHSAAKSKGIVSSAGRYPCVELVDACPGVASTNSTQKELEALAVLLQSERDRYFAQLQAVERLVDDFDALPNTPQPLLYALRSALYPQNATVY